jgi:hypothetical protein
VVSIESHRRAAAARLIGRSLRTCGSCSCSGPARDSPRLKPGFRALPQKGAWPHARHPHFLRLRNTKAAQGGKIAFSRPGSPPARPGSRNSNYYFASQCRHTVRLESLKRPQHIAHILPNSRFLAGIRPGYPTQLRSLTDQLHQKNGPQTIRLRLFLENEPQAERVLRDSIGMVLHQLNGFMVFSLSSLSAAFQR